MDRLLEIMRDLDGEEIVRDWKDADIIPTPKRAPSVMR